MKRTMDEVVKDVRVCLRRKDHEKRKVAQIIRDAEMTKTEIEKLAEEVDVKVGTLTRYVFVDTEYPSDEWWQCGASWGTLEELAKITDPEKDQKKTEELRWKTLNERSPADWSVAEMRGRVSRWRASLPIKTHGNGKPSLVRSRKPVLTDRSGLRVGGYRQTAEIRSPDDGPQVIELGFDAEITNLTWESGAGKSRIKFEIVTEENDV